MPVVVPFFTGAKQLTIDLAEPVVILRGGAKDKITHVLQGEVNIVLTKPVLASRVVIQFIGKAHSLWPEGIRPASLLRQYTDSVFNPNLGIGARGTKLYHEKIIHEQNVILQSFLDSPKQEGTLAPGIHRWPFQFLLSNQLIETIEDEMAKVFYYVTATVHRVGVGATKLRSRRDILLLRTPHWSDNALTANSLPTTSITSERHMDVCDTTICIEKSIVSSGTQFPISLSISPNIKHAFIESISVILTEKRVYRLPEFQARRVEVHDFKVPILSVSSLVDPGLGSTVSHLSLKEIKRALGVKNAHISLNNGSFQHRIIFTLPNCVHLNHSTTYSEIDIRHTLKLHIELTSPYSCHDTNSVTRTNIHLETPITILDCRLKEDYNSLPTYEEALLFDPVLDEDVATSKPTGFFLCPCYLEYQKKRHCSRREWIKLRNQPSSPDVSPPSYESIQPKR